MAIPATIPLLFQSRVQAHPDVTVQAYKDETGKFKTRSYRELYGDMLDFGSALIGLGIKRGDHVGIISDNRREWLISDLAILSLGAVDVPRGCDSMEKEISFILSTTDCTVSCIENKNQLIKILNHRDSMPVLTTLIMYNDPSQEDIDAAAAKGLKLLAFRGVIADGAVTRAQKPEAVEKELVKGTGDDVATIIFTSGTTGEPKGVMLTHSNYTWQLERTPDLLFGEPGDMWLSVLPVWHSFERLMQYIILERASGMAYSKPLASIMLPDIAAIRPQILPGVPRLWEALAGGILRSVKKEGGIKKSLFMFFVGIGKKYVWAHDMVFGRLPRFTRRIRLLDTIVGFLPWIALFPLHLLGDVLVYRKVRAKLGGRIRICLSGGGALQRDIDEFYRAIGLSMLEGYGITETAPLLSIRDQYKPRPGCVGAIIKDTDCRIVDTETLARTIDAASGGNWKIPEGLPAGKAGVIMVRGGQVMKGYYKRDDLSRKVLDADRWFNTGDLGMLSLDGDIKITGRAKDTIVLLGGENIEPSPIERAMKSFDGIESVVVLGQDKKYLAALIVPVKDALLAFAAENDRPCEDYEALLEDPEVIQHFRTAIDARVNHQNGFRPFEFIFRFTLLKDSFQVGKELSGKQEMMRHRINEIYKKEIDALFAN